MALANFQALLRPRSWPRGSVDQLLRALMLPEPEARSAWRDWTKERDFDAVSWPEMRLLAPLARRLATLDPESPLRPRIDGLAKNLWTQTQLNLRDTASAFDRFRAAGVPFMVFKGAAQTAEGLAASNRRIMGDVDMLVHQEDMIAALDVLEADGWTPKFNEPFDYLRRIADVRLSGGFTKGKGSEIDLHSAPFHFARIDPALDRELWSRARIVKLALRDILVPDPTDAVLLLLAHSATSGNGDWAIDLAARIEEQAIDWQRLAILAARRGLVPASLSGLRYLDEVLGVAVPREALAALARRRVPFAERLKYWSAVREQASRNILEKIGGRIADRWLRHRGFGLSGFDQVVPDRRPISLTRPDFGSWRPGRILIAVETSPAVPALQHRLNLPVVNRPQRLLLDIEIVQPAKSRRLFFEVGFGDVSIARLRARAGGSKAGQPMRFSFAIPLPDIALRQDMVLIDARPVRFVPPDAPAQALADVAPVPFRVTGAWISSV